MADAQSILQASTSPQGVKADAWDAYMNTANADELATRLQKLPLDQNTRAALWDLKEGEAHFSATATATPEPRSVGGFLKNALTSGGHMLEGLATAVRHPLNTIGAAADLAAGGLNAAGEKIGIVDPNRQRNDGDKTFDAFADQMKQRYGGGDAILKTMYDDPVGFLADASTLLGGVAGVSGKLAEVADMAKLAKIAEAARNVQTVAGVASKADPVYLASQPVAAGVDAASGAVARRLYSSALKPSKALPVEDMENAVQTGLSERLNPAKKADLDTLRARLVDVRQQIADGIAARPGVTIDPQAVAQRVDDVVKQFQTVNPSADLKDIEKVRQDFLKQFTLPAQPASNLVGPNGQPLPAPPAPTPQPIPLDQAQDMKLKSNAKLKAAYGEQGVAAVEAQKALVRGLKEEIEKVFPEIEQLNGREGSLMNLEPQIEAAVKREMTRDVIPGGVGDRAALLKKFFDDKNKARIAIMLEKVPAFAPSTGMKVGQRLALIESRLKNYLDAANAPALATGQ